MSGNKVLWLFKHSNWSKINSQYIIYFYVPVSQNFGWGLTIGGGISLLQLRPKHYIIFLLKTIALLSGSFMVKIHWNNYTVYKYKIYIYISNRKKNIFNLNYLNSFVFMILCGEITIALLAITLLIKLQVLLVALLCH